MRTYSKPFRRRLPGGLSRIYSVWIYEDGQQHRRSTRARTYREAQEVVESWRAQEITAKQPPSFQRAVQLWLDSKAGRISKDYLAVYRSYTNQWLDVWPKASLEAIQAPTIDRYLKLRILRGLSPVSVNNERAALRAFFGWCVDLGWIVRNPMRLISKFPEPRRHVRSLAPDQEQALLKAAQEEGRQVYGFVLCLLYSGLRRGTVAALEWTHVDLVRGEWQIPAEAMKSREAFAGRPIAQPLREWLQANRRPYGRIYGPLRKEAWKAVIGRANLPGLRPHDLRRTFFTRCRRAGTSLEVAMWLTDHRDLKTALACYREVDSEEAREALEKTFRVSGAQE